MSVPGRMLLLGVLLANLSLAGLALPARAEKLVVVLAAERIGITSSFSGTQVVAITVVERDGQSISRSGAYDAVALIRGPERTQVTRRKVRWAGLWVNGPSRTYVGAPTYFAAIANRPFADIAGDEQVPDGTSGDLRGPDSRVGAGDHEGFTPDAGPTGLDDRWRGRRGGVVVAGIHDVHSAPGSLVLPAPGTDVLARRVVDERRRHHQRDGCAGRHR